MPSGEMPPPGTTQCRCGWFERTWPQVWSTAKNPIGAQRLGGGPEQNIVDGLLVLQGNGGDGLRYGEDHVKILGVEKLGSAVFQPLGANQTLALWAVPVATAVVADALVVTAIAVLDVSPKRCSSTQLDGAYGATLCSA